MKKVLFAFAAILAFAACGNKQEAPATEGASNDVPFTVAKNYFFKNNADIPASPMITSEEAFNNLFGMATTMGEDGKPTEIDFAKQVVLAIVCPVTDYATEVTPVKVEEKGDTLFYTYQVTTGEKQSFSTQPVSLILIDKKYEGKEVVLINEQEVAYLPVIDRYLVDTFGKQYAEGEHCVPVHNIVGIDNRNPDDILVWGDYWVFNYNLVGDTLKCVSGGSHPGLMHIRQAEDSFEVVAFDQVEDGARNLPSAKKIFGDRFDTFQAINSDEKAREALRAEVLSDYVKTHNLSATLYQDYGWPAKPLE